MPHAGCASQYDPMLPRYLRPKTFRVAHRIERFAAVVDGVVALGRDKPFVVEAPTLGAGERSGGLEGSHRDAVFEDGLLRDDEAGRGLADDAASGGAISRCSTAADVRTATHVRGSWVT
jgi:hypothetical protein